MFASEVQFGHAGACANSDRETANSKNKALLAAGARVPNTFDDLGDVIQKTYHELVQAEIIEVKDEEPPSTVPMDFSWARY